MTNTIKTAVAALALVATPALVSAESLAVSLSATFDGTNTSANVDLTDDTAEVSSPTSLSVAAATGAKAAASTAGVTVDTTADATFANSGGGEVAKSEQIGSFDGDDYTATVSFADPK